MGSEGCLGVFRNVQEVPCRSGMAHRMGSRTDLERCGGCPTGPHGDGERIQDAGWRRYMGDARGEGMHGVHKLEKTHERQHGLG